MKRIFITLILLLWGANLSILAQTKFVVLNDTTLYCQKDNAGFITQFNNGKVSNKEKVAALLKIPKANDTVFWNNLRDSIKTPVKPKTQLFVLYPSQNNPDKSFIWYIKNKTGLHWINSYKTANETNFFAVDPLVQQISGEANIRYEDNIYKSIINNLSGFSGKIKNENKIWKKIRDSLRKKLNIENYKQKLIGYKNNNGKTDYIFISKLPESGILPLYHFNSKLKEIKPQNKIVNTVGVESDKVIISNKDIIFFSVGILFTLLMMTSLYFLYRKKIMPLLISKNANQIVQTGLPKLIKGLEPKFLESFENISKEFTDKFNIYNDISKKLNIDDTKIDTNKAFIHYLNKELEKYFENSNNIKTLLDIGKYENANKTLQEYEAIFSKIQESDFIDENRKQRIANNKKDIINIIEELKQCENNLEEKDKENKELLKQNNDIGQEKEKIGKELSKFEDFHNKLQYIINTIRDLEIRILRFSVVKKNSNDPKNDVLYYLMQLQTLLNILYCSVSNCGNLDNQINNLKQMKIWNNEEVKTLIDTLKEISIDIHVIVESGDKNLSHAMYQKVFDLFNRDVDNFPSPFYYGIGNDMVAK